MASKPVSKRRSHAFAGLAVVAIVALAPMAASADSLFDLFAPSVSPAAVQYNLARAGFVARSAMVRRGEVYIYDVSDRYGVPQRLIIDYRTGRIVERYSLRPAQLAEARRRDVRPRVEDDFDSDWGDDALRPEVDLPLPRSHIVEAAPLENPPVPPHMPRQGDLAYGNGAGHLAAPPVLLSAPDPKPVEKPRPKLARPKLVSPTPTASEPSQTATVAPAAADPSGAQASAPSVAAPAATQAAPAPQQPATATPAAAGMVASSGASDAAPAKAAAPQPAPAPKAKAINDIPVAPLD